jgi:4-amino-4-deoxy-L-arabinose transferase-like glycosyltransferase
MNPALSIIWLGWACYAGALAAIIVYIIHFAGRQGWKRPWNAAGLFFTAIALTQVPFLFQDAFDRSRFWRALVVVICLLAATILQAVTALRRRRRASDAPAPDAAQGPKA